MNFSKSKYFDFVLNTTNTIDGVQNYFKEHGAFDPQLAEVMIATIKPGAVVYDIGANIFEFTEIAARLAGPTGKVYSFEPQLNLVAGYREAQKLNSYEDAAEINVYDFGLSNEDANVVLNIPVTNVGGASFSDKFVEYSNTFGIRNDTQSVVSVKRLDSLDIPETIPDFIKIDIEGAEWLAWQGFPEHVKKARSIVAEIGTYTEKELLEEYLNGRSAYHMNGEVISWGDPQVLYDFIVTNHRTQYNIWFK